MKQMFLFWAGLLLSLTGVRVAASSLPIDTEVIKKSIVFLYYPKNDGTYEVGTGFLVGIPLKGDPIHMHLVIVTARHIVDPQWAGCSWSNPEVLFARVNAKNYKPEGTATGVWQTSLKLLANGQRTWLAHQDEMVDVAVIPVDGTVGIMDNDVTALRLSDFGTKEEIAQFKIGIGDEIISAGLVPQLLDVNRNYPAFKFGRVSNVLDEPVKMRCEPTSTPMSRLSWIVAGNFVGGNSGSPIFLLPIEFTLAPPLQFNGPRTMLLGLLSGSIEGADLAEMVPVEFIFEVIQHYYPDGDLYRGSDKDKPQGVTAKQP